MVSGGTAILLLLVAVLVIIIATGKWKVNAFVVLLVIAFAYGIAVGMPVSDVLKNVKNGFGGILSSIGIVIIAGTMMGIILEKTGAAMVMTRAILKVLGKERSPLAMNIAGYVVSIPVFCDSGYIILTPLNKSLAKETGKSMAVMAVALGTGLFATHTMVPPTPGPIAAAETLNANLGLVIILGLIASIPACLAGYYWAVKVASKYYIEPQTNSSYKDDVGGEKKELPGTAMSFLPLVLPIILILLKSVADLPVEPFGKGSIVTKFFSNIGDPVCALMIGVATALLLVPKGKMGEAVDGWLGQGIKDAAFVLAITAAGGSFGKILQTSPIVEYIKENLASANLGIFLPFIIAAALKTAQGSSTVAIITTANIVAPLLITTGINPALVVIAIGAGAMVVSHANDSYFWVVSQFSNMPANTAYKVFTTATAVEGTVAMVAVYVMSYFF